LFFFAWIEEDDGDGRHIFLWFSFVKKAMKIMVIVTFFSSSFCFRKKKTLIIVVLSSFMDVLP